MLVLRDKLSEHPISLFAEVRALGSHKFSLLVLEDAAPPAPSDPLQLDVLVCGGNTVPVTSDADTAFRRLPVPDTFSYQNIA